METLPKSTIDDPLGAPFSNGIGRVVGYPSVAFERDLVELVRRNKNKRLLQAMSECR